MTEVAAPPGNRLMLLFHYCRMQLPTVRLANDQFHNHLQRTFTIYASKAEQALNWQSYLDTLYVLDWYLCAGCLEGDDRAWQQLFASRTGRSDCLLVDALRARVVRLYPRDEERQETALVEFWSHLIVSESPGSIPVLARYDGQRPLGPWLIRVFQNRHVSQLRTHSHTQSMPDDDLAPPLPERTDTEIRWHDLFCDAARNWLTTLSEQEVLLLGLRWRYRLSQREVAKLFKVHEGTITRQIDRLRDRCLEQIGAELVGAGWSGDDITSFIITEMGSLLMDDPNLSIDRLSALCKKKGILELPAKEMAS